MNIEKLFIFMVVFIIIYAILYYSFLKPALSEIQYLNSELNYLNTSMTETFIT